MAVATVTGNPTGKELVQRQLKSLSEQVRSEDFKDQIRDLLPENVSPDRFASVIVTALRDDVVRQSKPEYMLVNADRESFLQAAVRCAQDGLLPDGHEAALVVFGGKVQYMPMVGGLRKIAAEYGWTIRARAVREHDHFVYTEEPPTLKFRQAPTGTDRGELVYAYAVARHRDGRPSEQCVMTRDEVLKRRKVAKTQNVWNAWEDEMWAKTPAKDLFDELPLNPLERERMLRVLSAMDGDPAAAAARSLYGAGSDRVLQASPAGSLGDAPGEDRQTAPDVVATSPTSGATGDTATAPIDGGGEQAGYNPQEDASPDVTAAREAGLFVPPFGQHLAANRTLDDVLAQGEDGLGWFRKVCVGAPEIPAGLNPQAWQIFYKNLAAFTKVYLPDLYEAAGFGVEIEL